MDGTDFDVWFSCQECVEVAGGLTFLAFRTDANASEAGEGTALVERKPDVAPLGLLNSLNELNDTTQRFSAPSQRVQCLLFT
jgi:hypothetical protein